MLQRFRKAPAEPTPFPRLALIGHGAGALAGAIGVLVLLGYGLDIEFLRRPVPSYPAIHPVTAICLVMIGFAAVTRRWPWLAVPASVAAAGLAMLRLIDVGLHTDLLPAITPFGSVLLAQVDVPHAIAFGTNTAVGMLALSAAQVLAWRKAWIASQVICCIGTMPFAIALMGYVYGIRQFHGVLTPGTAIAGLLAAAAVLLAEPGRGILRALLGSGAPGRLARQLLGGSTAIAFLVGWALSAYTDAANGLLLATEVVIVIAFLSAIVTFTTVRFERSDVQRVSQEAELLQALLELRIGQRDRAEESRMFRAAFEHIEQGILMIDAARRVVLCNSHAIEMMGLPPELMASRPPFDEVLAYLRRSGEFDSSDAGRRDLLRAGTLHEGSDVYQRRRPNGRIIEVRSVPLAGGGVVRTFRELASLGDPEMPGHSFTAPAAPVRVANRPVARRFGAPASALAEDGGNQPAWQEGRVLSK